MPSSKKELQIEVPKQVPAGYSLSRTRGSGDNSFGMEMCDEIANLLLEAQANESVGLDPADAQLEPESLEVLSEEKKHFAGITLPSQVESPKTKPSQSTAQSTETTGSKTTRQKLQLPQVCVTPSTTGANVSNIAPARSAPPMPHRPKGRGFVLFVFLTIFGGIGYLLYSGFMKVESFGIVEGHLVAVGAPWDGTVGRWLVREGDEIKQGQVLAEINNLEIENRIATLGDELKVAQAELEAEMSKIQFNFQIRNERIEEQRQKSKEALLTAQGQLQLEQVKLDELEFECKRTSRLNKKGSVSRSTYEAMLFEYAAQREKVEALENTTRFLTERSKIVETNNQPNGSTQLNPILAKIEFTQSELSRLRKTLELGQLKSPCDGRVTKRHCLSGEATLSGAPVVDILENNSVEAVLYVPQKHTGKYQPGDTVQVVLDPYPEPLECTVHRLGDCFEAAPPNIARHYSMNQYLLPVYLKPTDASRQWMSLRINGTIKREFDIKGGFNNFYEESSAYLDKLKKSIFAPDKSSSQTYQEGSKDG